ncbi:MAG: YceI family protein [Deltaproteobacteria bacterium]|nr:YceI family protein [Deltaproteobacteria bacterium]
MERWELDSGHSSVNFSVRHLVIARVRGQFARWSGAILAEGGDPAKATVDVTIDAASIQTGVADRDAHLRSADFLDVASHPELTFRGQRVERVDAERLRVHGDLTLRGTTRPVTLDVEYAGRTRDPWGNERMGFSAKTSILRKDYGLTWNQVLEAGGVAVGDRVDIELEVEAVRQAK